MTYRRTPITGGVSAGSSSAPQTQQSGTTYTFALTDANSIVEFTAAGAVTATVPPAASVAWPAPSATSSTIIQVYAAGAGGLTVAAGAGVTIRNNTAALTQYGEVSLRYRGSDEWVRVG